MDRGCVVLDQPQRSQCPKRLKDMHPLQGGERAPATLGVLGFHFLSSSPHTAGDLKPLGFGAALGETCCFASAS
jgi:hypothetical protein